jgi:gliding motility-associated-like protein
MKKLLLALQLVLLAVTGFSQINAGPDQNICPPQTATLTATYTAPIPGSTLSLSDDQFSGAINIGFPFTYFGTSYTQCLISSNNYITFNTSSAGGYSPWSISSAIPSSSNPTNAIMCPWQDLLPPSGGTIRYATVGTAPNRVFVVSFCSVAMFSCTSMQFTSQIKLYEGTNIIETHITNKPLCTTWNSGYAIHGIQNSTGTIAYVIPGRNYPSQWTTSNEGYRFTPTGSSTYTQAFIPYSPTNIGTTTSTVSWYIGSTLVGTGPSITVSPASTTTYTASIIYACNVLMSDQVVVNVGALNAAVTPATSTICQGAAGTQLTASGLGATGFSWSPAAGLSCTTCANLVATPTVTTTYTVSITNGTCTTTKTATVNVTPLPAVNAGPDVSICQGGGGTTLAATGNAASYSWSPSAGLSCSTCLTPVANPTVTTTYTLTGNNGSCTSQDIVVVTVNPLPVANAGADQGICQGGSAQLNGSGGTTYSWSPAGSLSCSTCANPVAAPTVTTNYTLTVSQNGCSSTDVTTISILPAAQAYAGIDDTICSGGSTVLNATGGTTYSWSPSSGLSATNIANPVASPFATTTYTVTVSNAAGCSGTDQVTIVVPQPIILATGGFPATCNSACNGQTVVIPSGGVQPYSYLWSPGNQTTASVMNQCAGTYTIQVTDAIGCTGTATVTVTEPTALALTTSSMNSHCGQPDGSATVNATGGTPPYTYLWQGGGTASVKNNLAPGQYCVTVTDANNCTATTCVTVGNTPGVTASIVSFTSPTCFNSCNGTATALGTGGTQPFQYSWLPSGGTAATASGLCAGTYTVTITDANNCSSTATVVITDPAQLVVTPQSSTTICIGQCVSLTSVAAGGTAPYSYSWSPAGPSICPVTTTTYSVVATDANGCTSTPAAVTINVNPALNVTAAGAQTICPSSQATLVAEGTGGNGNLSYTWLPQGTGTGSTVTVSPYVTTTYSVIISDGCTTPHDTATVTVTVASLPQVSFTSDVTSGCSPVCVNFTNTTPGAVSQSWSLGNGNSSTLAGPQSCYVQPGSYTVSLTVTDNNGCTNSATVPGYITSYENPVADFNYGPQPTTILSPTIDFGDISTGSISSWEWSFGDVLSSGSASQNPQYTYADTGHYEVMLVVTTVNGCMDTAYHTVEIRADFAFYLPNAFTPNGDGLNDRFGPSGMGIDTKTFEMMIFDRWGNMIFQTNEWMKDWDGYVNGNDVIMEDVYVWKVSFADQYGARHNYMGHVSVIK